MKKALLKIFLLLFLSCSLCGCINIKLPSNDFVQKRYSLTIALPKQNAIKPNSGNLEVYYPKIDPKFSGQSFVYKLNNYNYITDAYNIFLDLPTNEIQQITINYLQKVGKFKYVAAEVYPAKTNFFLKIFINKLYADYTNRNIPKGVIAINFTLFDIQNKNQILLSKNYQSLVNLKEKSSIALVNAWSVGLNQILQHLNSDLSKLNLTIKSPEKKPLYNANLFRPKPPEPTLKK